MKPKLEYASHGPYVTEAQTKLNALMPDEPPLKVDGKYGEKCVARVKQFQKSRGMVADGLVGAKTWAALDGGAPATGPTEPAGSSPSKPGTIEHKALQVFMGMRTRCTSGSKPHPFMSPKGAMVPATVADCQPFLNVGPFGECQSDKNPNYEPVAPYKDPFMKDVSFSPGFKPMKMRPPCSPNVTSQWSGAFIKQGDKTQLIDKTARCNCKYGGTIYFG